MSTIKIRFKRLESAVLIRILIAHPMETGRRQEGGATVPAHFIQELKIEHNGKLVASCQFSTAVSRDPYLSVRLREGKPGDSIKVSWFDNLGQSDSEEARIA
ncbi:MAG: thiosulfate oxidation carrier complex protein SoxZ [Methylococcaceae bacterium]|nr:thiosulfate oxidation carrier complex protein SoxZ [Methylococcaceae bacterium]